MAAVLSIIVLIVGVVGISDIKSGHTFKGLGFVIIAMIIVSLIPSSHDTDKPQSRNEAVVERNNYQRQEIEENNYQAQENYSSSVNAPVGEHWIKDSNGVYLWNPEPNPNETITWTGGYVQDGQYRYANGSGVVTWYLNGEFEQQDEGRFVHGRHDGQFKHTFPSGRVVYSNWDNGVEIP